jgi:hypothetical protein
MVAIFMSEKQSVYRITGFVDLPTARNSKQIENTTFQKLDLFPSSGKEGDVYSVGSLRKS